jgi:hypothetical protein
MTRRLGLLAALVVCVVMSGTSAPAFGATSACAPACGRSAVESAHTAPTGVCIRDASCGGGGVMGLSTSSAPIALVAGSAALAFALGARRRRALPVVLPAGVLLRRGLFRPPRPAFAV